MSSSNAILYPPIVSKSSQLWQQLTHPPCSLAPWPIARTRPYSCRRPRGALPKMCTTVRVSPSPHTHATMCHVQLKSAAPAPAPGLDSRQKFSDVPDTRAVYKSAPTPPHKTTRPSHPPATASKLADDTWTHPDRARDAMVHVPDPPILVPITTGSAT
ncbi:hypothetical protein JB92DRAFT_13659 [Gautieria morchelliformis]|nr:hypothetical protein JB92DRAFT_13659 [Gautieria morchelliformis]